MWFLTMGDCMRWKRRRGSMCGANKQKGRQRGPVRNTHTPASTASFAAPT